MAASEAPPPARPFQAYFLRSVVLVLLIVLALNAPLLFGASSSVATMTAYYWSSSSTTAKTNDTTTTTKMTNTASRLPTTREAAANPRRKQRKKKETANAEKDERTTTTQKHPHVVETKKAIGNLSVRGHAPNRTVRLPKKKSVETAAAGALEQTPNPPEQRTTNDDHDATPKNDNSNNNDRITHALHELNYTALNLDKRTACCHPFGSETDDNCRRTCFTAAACDKPASLFPYRSAEERDFLKRMRVSRQERVRHCGPFLRHHPTLTHPQWCHRRLRMTTEDSSSSSSSSSQEEGFFNDSSLQFHNGCGFAPYDRMLVFPEHKLAFCGIPKVGITQWIKFLRFSFGAVDYQSLPYYKADKEAFVFSNLPRHRQVQILTDPTWTKAVFLRHPAERLLSAYLDKVQGRKGRPQNYTFASFVHDLDTQPVEACNGTAGPSWCTDPHWRPQYYSCGLHELLPLYDFVGHMDHAAVHTQELLQRVQLWDDYGQAYVTVQRRDKPKAGGSCHIAPEDPATFRDDDDDVHVVSRGFQQDLRAKADQHTRNSRAKMNQYYDTAELQETVQRMYAHDYQLWNALQESAKESSSSSQSWATGRALAQRLNPKQCQSGQ